MLEPTPSHRLRRSVVSTARNEHLTAYARRDYKRVEGWLIPSAVDAVLTLALVQREHGVRGPVCEIGIHHGQLFILLHLLTDGDEVSVAWDLFDRQAENVDQSGCGNKERFVYNLQRHHCDREHIKIRTENSLQLKPETILLECEGHPRLFSVDGGHTAEIAYNDLRLAHQTLCDGGLILVDDVYSEGFPAVAEGTCRYLFGEGASLIPVAAVGNKLFLTNDRSMAQAYQRTLDEPREGFWVRRSVAFGQELVVIVPELRKPPKVRNWIGATRPWVWLRNRSLGRCIRTLVHRGPPPP